MNIKEFKTVFPVLRKHKIVPFLWGNQGIGKTQVVKQCAKQQGLNFIHLHLATQEVGDLVGLLKHDADGTVSHARPEWFPTSGEGVIFLDELNRAHPETLQAMFSFITEGTMHRHKLPEGWSIVAAGNYQNNEFNTTDMSDAAWYSRFCHIDFQPTKEEFIIYAEEKEAFEVAGFIRENGDCLEREVKMNNLTFIAPDRRAWLTMISPLENEESIENERYELYKGCVGESAAAAFMTYKKKKEKAVSAKQVLFQYDKVKEIIKLNSNPKNSRLDTITKTANEVLSRLIDDENLLNDEKVMNNLFEFLTDIPRESTLTFLNSLKDVSNQNKSIIMNSEKFAKKLKNRILEK